MYELANAYGLFDHPHARLIQPVPCSEEDLATVHSIEYIEAVKHGAERFPEWDLISFGLGTDDNPIFSQVYKKSLLAVGASLQAAKLVENNLARNISILTYMELLQGAADKEQHKYSIRFINDFNFKVLPLTENIGHRAAIYVEEYSLSHNLRAGDAIIAAFCDQEAIDIFVSENRHFLQELPERPFQIPNSE